MSFSAVVLAAGSSRRMGEDKLLMDIDGKPMLECVVSNILSAVSGRVAVVLRPGAERARALLEGMGDQRLMVVENPEPERGMKSSLACGLDALMKDPGEGTSGPELFLIALSDQPLIKARTVQDILDTASSGRPEIVIPRYHGKKGHPVAFSNSVAREFLDAPADIQVREVFHRHADSTHLLDVEDRGVLVDLDTRDQYDALLSGEKV